MANHKSLTILSQSGMSGLFVGWLGLIRSKLGWMLEGKITRNEKKKYANVYSWYVESKHFKALVDRHGLPQLQSSDPMIAGNYPFESKLLCKSFGSCCATNIQMLCDLKQ